MSTARHHAEWLSLVEVSGPFLSLPVLLQVFPNGLEAHEPEQMRVLRLAHEEWEDNQKSLQPETAIHRAWVEFVLQETLGLPGEVLLSGQAIPNGLQVAIAEHQETLRPDWVVVNPAPHPLTPSPCVGEGEQEDGSAPLARSGRGAGGEGLSPQQLQRLLIACNNDRALLDRILPFAKLIRLDTLDYPMVIPAGSVYVTEGVDRRQTGTHYTPRNLTEEIVQYTLEPLVYEGVAEGKPKEEWRLRSPAELLQLKICDMAMGSGAFLVQTCRYLAEKLVEAWQRELENAPHLSPLPGGEGTRDSEISQLAGRTRQIPAVLLQRARELRSQQTSAEEILWECLRDRRLCDAKFRRQHNLGRFIADFYCHAAHLIVEVDGGIHHTQQERDAIRDEWATQNGFVVLRFTNDQVNEELEAVLGTIAEALRPHPLAPSPQGEGEQEDRLPSPSGRGVGGEGKIRILPDGSLSRAEVGEHILPTDPDERLTLARRSVADRCLYGVDKNPLAVEMAKLSLWLITLAKGRPFTFVDHALKCGDSLLGITRPEQIEFLKLNPEKEAVQLRTVSDRWKPFVQRAIAKRQALENFSVSDIADIQKKEQLNREAEAAIAHVRHVGDFLVAEALAQAGKTSDLTDEEIQVLAEVVIEALDEADVEKRNREISAILAKTERMMNLGNPANQPPRKPFHWLLEFPEVFLRGIPPHPLAPSPTWGEGEQEVNQNSGGSAPLARSGRGAGGEGLGFDAIVGNPPFQGGQKITGAIGTDYRNFLVEYLANGQRGSADLSNSHYGNFARIWLRLLRIFAIDLLEKPMLSFKIS
jgi:very-short-patch-repair endonuclease